MTHRVLKSVVTKWLLQFFFGTLAFFLSANAADAFLHSDRPAWASAAVVLALASLVVSIRNFVGGWRALTISHEPSRR
jgi:hypothetical protein